ncbi:MAG: hypothetical protein QOG05_7107 [Streptosporangiaceae bacterium]|jgi:hypothetical protein|nr:hypothetical protein [Streptosporangiaceae bacterium]
MSTRERSSRPDRPGPGRSLDAQLDALLDGGPLPDGDPRWQPVTQVLTALISAPESRELTGEGQALAEFRARAGQPELPSRAPRRAPRWVTSLRRARPALAAGTGAVLMGGLLTAAYVGDLPAPAQRLAHDTINAPPAGRPATTGPEPVLSQPASPLRRAAGRASSPPGHGASRPGRRGSGGDPSGSQRQHRPSGPASGPASPSPSGRPAHGIPAQSGSPSGSPTPGPTQQPSPSASTNPPAGATPSPSATPSATGRSGSHHRPRPSGTPSTPP